MWVLLFTENSAVTNYSGQSFYLYSTKNLKYCSNSWFILSVCLSVWGWNTINNFVLIPSILFNSFINFATNWGPLSDTTLSGNLYNFHILSQSSLANPSTEVPSIIATKYIIFDNWLQTTRIEFFLAIISNFVIKSTVRWVHGFFGISLNFNFSTTVKIVKSGLHFSV